MNILRLAGAAFALSVVAATVPQALAQPKLDTLVIEQGSDVVTLDPQLEVDAATGRVTQNIFDPLFRVGPNGEPVPHLAESYVLVDDRTWEIRLRKGVRFHNGEPFDAESVRFSIERSRDETIKPRPRLAAYYTSFERIEVVDPHTIRIHTKEPDPIVPRRLMGMFGPMLPAGYVREHGNDILKTRPVGTGPLKFVRWERDEQLVLEANADYWGPKAPVARVVFRPVSEVMGRVADLTVGRAHLITDVPPDQISELQRLPDVEVRSGMSGRNIHLIFNPLEGGPLSERTVRQALTHAVDVDAIIKSVLGGYGRRIATLFVPESAGFDPSIEPRSFDPDLARKMLAEAGYSNGFEVVLDVPSGRYLKGEEVAEAIAGQLAEVGVKVKLLRHEWGGFVKRWRARKLSGLTLIGAGDQMFDADQLLTSRLITNANYGGFYSNPRMDELILEGRRTTDPEARKKIYSEVQQLIREDAPILPLYQQPNIYGLSKRITWEPGLDEMIPVDTIKVTGQ